jgi:MFS transporter, AAHS family, 4-hydroxybenzoate transporter
MAGLGLNGLVANAVQTTMYTLAAHVYPTEVRASGVAAAAAIGRTGAIVSSFTGAAIIQAGSGDFLGALALSMMFGAIGLAVVKNHFHGTKAHAGSGEEHSGEEPGSFPAARGMPSSFAKTN